MRHLVAVVAVVVAVLGTVTLNAAIVAGPERGVSASRFDRAYGSHAVAATATDGTNFLVAWQNGDLKTALKLHDKLMPLHTNLFIESNPSPVKYALSLLGKMEETLRLPMVPVSEPTRVAVRSAMVHAGLIN